MPLPIAALMIASSVVERRWCRLHGFVCPHCARTTPPAIIEKTLGHCPRCKRLMVSVDADLEPSALLTESGKKIPQSMWYVRERRARRWWCLILVPAAFLPVMVPVAAGMSVTLSVAIMAVGVAGWLAVAVVASKQIAVWCGLTCPRCGQALADGTMNTPGRRRPHLDGKCPICGQIILRPN